MLAHVYGFFSERVSPAEKQFFLQALDSYGAGQAPLSAPLAILKAWIVRFDEGYLAQQAFFAPHAEDLVQITDSDKGRDL